MFWGKGDTSKLEAEELDTLSHLRRMEETGHIVALSPTQAAVALRALEFYTRFESAFRAMAMLRNTAGLVGFFLVAWWATEGWLFERIFGSG